MVILMWLGVLVDFGLLMLDWFEVLIVLFFSFIFTCVLFALDC